MTFSSRLLWDLRPNPISRLLVEKKARGARILDLTESNPTRAGFTYPAEDVLESLGSPGALEYSPTPLGLPSAREAVADYYAQRGEAVPAESILLTASTSEAYSYLFKLLADPGGEVLTPRPSYPLFEYLAGLESVRAVPYPLRYAGGWFIDLDALEAAVTERTRAVIAVSPNNPTGSFLKRAELARLAALCTRRGIALIADEVFSDYAFHPDPERAAWLAGEQRVLTFCLSGLSKVCGLPQMKLAWIVTAGPPELRAAAMERLELIADTYLSVNTPVQQALPRLLRAGCAVRMQIRERVRQNLAVLQSSCRVLEVEGGWYAIVQAPPRAGGEEWALALLGEADVLVQPGFFFDFDREDWLVVSLLTNPDVLTEGLRRILALWK